MTHVFSDTDMDNLLAGMQAEGMASAKARAESQAEIARLRALLGRFVNRNVAYVGCGSTEFNCEIRIECESSKEAWQLIQDARAALTPSIAVQKDES